MNLDEYTDAFGRIIINLQTIEHLLRVFLYSVGSPPHHPNQYGVSIYTFQVGDVVPENALTDYDSLGQLIDRYNSHIQATNPELQVDRTIVELRDAFAHGRVSAPATENIFSIVKFEKPRNGKTKITYNEKMTRDWLTRQILKLRTEMSKLRTATNAEFTPEL